MLYSTCKGPLLDVATDRVGLDIGRKVYSMQCLSGGFRERSLLSCKK